MTDVYGDILDFESWSSKAGYAIARKKFEGSFPLPEERAVDPALRIGLNQVERLRARGLLMAEGRNVDLISHLWFEPDRGPRSMISQVFFLKSQSGDILFDDSEWLRSLAGYSFLRDFNEGGQNCRFDFSGYGQGLHVSETCAYLGATNNWGHQICDVLPRLLVLESLGFPKDGKLVTGLLSPMFLELYEALGVSRDRILMIDHDANCHAVHRFDHLFIPADPPPDAGYAFLQERLRKIRGGNRATGSSQKIYFSRRSQGSRGRIVNQDEVEAFFEDRGFVIVEPENLSVAQLLDRLETAEIVAAQFGAVLGNQVLAHPSTVMLNLFPPVYFSQAVPDVVAAYWRSLYIPFLDRCVFALGKPEFAQSESILLKALDIPHRYDVRVLDQALMQAEGLALRLKAARKGDER